MRLGGATMDPPDQSNGLLVSLTRRQSPGRRDAAQLRAGAHSGTRLTTLKLNKPPLAVSGLS
jgi:hypothetical protein